MKAFLVFVDESGLLMAPLVRRSWAPCGQTPILLQRTRSHQKISMLAALCVSPGQNQVSLYFRLHPNQNVRTPLVIDFLRQLHRHLPAPMIVVWDNLTCHRARALRTWLESHPGIHLEFLPPYAPELNPVEYFWSYLKTNPLANVAATELDPLAQLARHHGRRLQRTPRLLRSFFAHSPLFLCLE